MKLAIYTESDSTEIKFAQLFDERVKTAETIDGYELSIVPLEYVFDTDQITVIEFNVFINNFDKFNCIEKDGAKICVHIENTSFDNRILTTLVDNTTPLTLGRANTVQYLGTL